jgi:HPr kinase/phosphorylase
VNGSLSIHATTVSLDGQAVVLRGPSGSGKSGLALRLIENGILIADDQTRLDRRGNQLFASAPPTIKGLLEVRGLGLVKVPTVDEAPVGLVVDLMDIRHIERMPLPHDLETEILNLTLPRLALDPAKPGATARIRLALRQPR